MSPNETSLSTVGVWTGNEEGGVGEKNFGDINLPASFFQSDNYQCSMCQTCLPHPFNWPTTVSSFRRSLGLLISHINSKISDAPIISLGFFSSQVLILHSYLFRNLSFPALDPNSNTLTNFFLFILLSCFSSSLQSLLWWKCWSLKVHLGFG